MIRIICLIIKNGLNFISDNYFKFFNKVIICSSKINYDQYPIIFGKIEIYNRGYVNFGKQVVFRSNNRSNYVGIYKPCTICVLEDAKLEIGDKSGFSGVSIYCSNYIKIGNFVKCGGNVCLWDTDFHEIDFLLRRDSNNKEIKSAPILIQDDVFIGANSIILKGVKIGKASIIGAGSVVTKNIPAGEIWAGNPAKFIRKII